MEPGNSGQIGVHAMRLVEAVGHLGPENVTIPNTTENRVPDPQMIGKLVIPTIVQVRIIHKRLHKPRAVLEYNKLLSLGT